MGASKYDLGISKPRGKRGKYQKLNPMEPRGLPEGKNREYNVQKSFWRRHKMEDIITLSGEELDAAIDKFFEVYEATQKKHDRLWWYPEVIRMKDMRNVDLRHRKV